MAANIAKLPGLLNEEVTQDRTMKAREALAQKLRFAVSELRCTSTRHS
jgi:hypothetical protein